MGNGQRSCRPHASRTPRAGRHCILPSGTLALADIQAAPIPDAGGAPKPSGGALGQLGTHARGSSTHGSPARGRRSLTGFAVDPVKRVIVRPAAAVEIEDAYPWYESQQPGVGAEFLRRRRDHHRRVHVCDTRPASVAAPVVMANEIEDRLELAVSRREETLSRQLGERFSAINSDSMRPSAGERLHSIRRRTLLALDCAHGPPHTPLA